MNENAGLLALVLVWFFGPWLFLTAWEWRTAQRVSLMPLRATLVRGFFGVVALFLLIVVLISSLSAALLVTVGTPLFWGVRVALWRMTITLCFGAPPTWRSRWGPVLGGAAFDLAFDGLAYALWRLSPGLFCWDFSLLASAG